MGIKTKIVTKTAHQTLYITSDGEEFASEWDAENHEEELVQQTKEDACGSFRKTISVKSLGSFLDNIVELHTPTIHFFNIKSEKELRLFCDAYSYWDRYFCNFNMRKELPYPQKYWLLDEIGKDGYIFVDQADIKEAMETFKQISEMCEQVGTSAGHTVES